MSFLTQNSEIDSADLSKLIVKAQHSESGYGWSKEMAEGVSELYGAFLFLCLTYPNENIVPPREVDEFWHLHILDTRSYHADCAKIFGHYLHHYPFAGLETIQSVENDEEMKIKTFERLQFHFPDLISREGADV